uniref:Putative secreted protein n=1 Tax=Anopheles marajoara TaxID=58244 RepID=A0A2M4C943_9DIPT
MVRRLPARPERLGQVLVPVDQAWAQTTDVTAQTIGVEPEAWDRTIGVTMITTIVTTVSMHSRGNRLERPRQQQHHHHNNRLLGSSWVMLVVSVEVEAVR